MCTGGILLTSYTSPSRLHAGRKKTNKTFTHPLSLLLLLGAAAAHFEDQITGEVRAAPRIASFRHTWARVYIYICTRYIICIFIHSIPFTMFALFFSLPLLLVVVVVVAAAAAAAVQTRRDVVGSSPSPPERFVAVPFFPRRRASH